MVRPSTSPPARGDPVAKGLILGLLVANTFLQKLAIPGTGGGLPLSLLVTVGLVAAGVATRRLAPVAAVLVAMLACIGLLLLASGLSPGSTVSLNAFALVAVLLVPYGFALRPGALPEGFAVRAFGAFAAGFAVLGIVQFFAQFVVGAERAFYLDLALPESLLLSGFNNLNELSYQAGIYKANGVFLLEAAFLNQFLCVAILLELLHARRLRRLALYGAGVLVTYSGTGVLMLAAITPAYLLHQRQFWLLGLGGLAAALVVLFGEAFGLGALLDRANEFSSDQSSGFARFLSIFYLLDRFVWVDPATILFGRGPGSVREYFTTVGFAAFDPSWGKVTYEYGLVGFGAYFAFLGFCVRRAAGSGYLKAALLIQFLFLGGYASTTPVHIELWTLLVWPTPARASAPARSRAGDHLPAGQPA